jgi:hypothetical protein
MFIRAVWRQKDLVDLRRAIREIGAKSGRNIGILGISPADFSNMTRGLFDRRS